MSCLKPSARQLARIGMGLSMLKVVRDIPDVSRSLTPPTASEMATLFAGWEAELNPRKWFPRNARNFAAAKLMSQIGLRINEVVELDLADLKWEYGRVGKIHIRVGKGSFFSGPRQRVIPMLNGSAETLRWFVDEVRGRFKDDRNRIGAPLFPSTRRDGAGSFCKLDTKTLANGLAVATNQHLAAWSDRLTPHVLRHFCATQFYLDGMDPHSIREILGHSWLHSTVGYIHVPAAHVERSWAAGQDRAAQRLRGLLA